LRWKSERLPTTHLKGKAKMPNKRQALVIGLDGATFSILQPLMTQGNLPHLSAMQRQGSWERLLSTIPPVTAPAWSSFMTGVNPARHSVFGFFLRDPTGYAYEETVGFVHAGLIRHPTLWDTLSQDGLRIGAVNVPLTYPPRPVNGFMITGMLTPPSTTRFTYPPELAEQLDGYLIDLDYTRGETGFDLTDGPDEDNLLQAVNDMLDRRARHCLRLMAEQEWDCFVVVFVGTDRLFHELWHYLDPSCAAYDSARGATVRHAVNVYLNRLDAVVGQLRSVAGPRATTIVMSDHGFGPAPEKRVNLNDWLVDLGLLHVAQNRSSWFRPEFWATRLGLRRPGVKQKLERWVPLHLLRRAGADMQGRREVPADWHRTRAHAVQMYNHICGIEINLEGRKRHGIVAPGSEYEQIRDYVLSELSKLCDPDSLAPLVKAAYRREAVFEGDHIDQVPDIVIELDPQYAGLAPLGNGRLVTTHNPRRQGDHRREGIFLAQGPNVVPGEISRPPSLVDLAPTIQYILGVPVHQELDGRVLTEIFDPEFVALHPISFAEGTNLKPMEETDQSLSEKDMAEISDRLRGLGYLD
jgi:predicted AlkP superfamily phosphohydrolase/phosphomutase